MKFQTTDRRDVGRLQGYLSVYARRKLLEDPNAFCLCALEDGFVVGAAVFEVGKTTYIREINLMEEYCDFAHAGEFLDRLCEISRRCGNGIMFDAHSDDHPYLWEFVLQEEAFQCVNTMEQAEFVLGDALAHPMMSKKGPFKGISPLAETDSSQRQAYDKWLKDKQLYDGFLLSEVSFRMSSVSIADGRINGCFLIEERDPETLWILFAHVEKAASVALMEMVVASLNRIGKYYGPRTRICSLNTNEKSVELFNKLPVSVEKRKLIRNYYKAFVELD